jgi:hypothetical protein
MTGIYFILRFIFLPGMFIPPLVDLQNLCLRLLCASPPYLLHRKIPSLCQKTIVLVK